MTLWLEILILIKKTIAKVNLLTSAIFSNFDYYSIFTRNIFNCCRGILTRIYIRISYNIHSVLEKITYLIYPGLYLDMWSTAQWLSKAMWFVCSYKCFAHFWLKWFQVYWERLINIFCIISFYFMNLKHRNIEHANVYIANSRLVYLAT